MGETKFIRTDKFANYSMIDNAVLRDARLSWKAKGIMCYILSLPVTWKIFAKEVERHATDGNKSFRAGIKELEAYGYIIKRKSKDNMGRFSGWDYEVIENPGNMPLSPKAEKRMSDNRTSENGTLLSTDQNNNLSLQTISEEVYKVRSDGSNTGAAPKNKTVFEKATERFGAESCHDAIRIVDDYIDRVYPKRRNKKHPAVNRAARMVHAIKLLECEDKTGIEMNVIIAALNDLLNNANCDQTIMYATTSKVLGYWLLRQEGLCFENVQHTEYEPVEEYY